jgi:hypothetical protein
MKRRIVSGQFELGVSAGKAIRFFTPEAEKEWVPGWNPVYPGGEPSDTPGTVFITGHHDVDTIWVILSIDTTERTVAYARVTPGHHAGTVRVSCTDTPDGRCVVSVTYDMSLLPGSDPAGLDAYDESSFGAMMNHWSEAVRRHL